MPYPVESILSGVQQSVPDNQELWYQKRLEFPLPDHATAAMIRFGPMQEEISVWINGHAATPWESTGESTAFLASAELFHAIENEIVVRISNDSLGNDSSDNQTTRSASGLRHSVSLQVLGKASLVNPAVFADVDDGRLLTNVELQAAQGEYRLVATVLHDDVELVRQARTVHADEKEEVSSLSIDQELASYSFSLPIESAQLWSPTEPNLYTLQLELFAEGEIIDRIETYVGFRSLAIATDRLGRKVVALNGARLFIAAAEDSAWWPDGLSTAPSDEAIRSEIVRVKQLGFNAVLQPENRTTPRFLYWADRLGLLVLQSRRAEEFGLDEGIEAPVPIFPGSEPNHRSPSQVDHLNWMIHHPSFAGWMLEENKEADNEEERPRIDVAFDEFSAQLILRRPNDDTAIIDSVEAFDETLESGRPDFATTPVLVTIALDEIATVGHIRNPFAISDEEKGYATNSVDSFFLQVIARIDELKSTGFAGVIVDALTDQDQSLNGIQTFDRAFLKYDQESIQQAIQASGGN